MIPKVICIDDNGESNFTTGKIYFITENGIIGDTGYIYNSFLDIEIESLEERWLKWIKSTGVKFNAVNSFVKRF